MNISYFCRLSLLIRLTVLLCCLLVLTRAHADYIARSAAMTAPTIAQFFVDSDGVLLELDIGAEDLPAFAMLLPDELRRKMQLDAASFAERFEQFRREGLPVLDEQGEPLPARLLSMRPQPKIERDPITGEPLPADTEAPLPHILRVRIQYDFNEGELPGRLVFSLGRLQPRPTVGFVAYHRSVAVNEFRYLTDTAVLQLDWEDPWYTQFSRRSMRRTYFSPMNGFIYVEPYEVRKEVIVRPKDMQRWVDLGLDGVREITPSMYPGIKQRLAEFLGQHLHTTIDGEEAVGQLLGVNFLERKLTSSRVIDPPETLQLDSAIVGAIWVYPTLGLPQRVDVEWDLFDERIDRVSAAAVDQAGPLPILLEPDFSTLTWENFLQNPEQPTAVELLPPPTRWQRIALPARWLAMALLVVVTGWLILALRRKQPPGQPAALALVLLTATVGLFALAAQRPMNQQAAESLVAGLLHNIYRAFDFRQDEQIYDALARSVNGDLLTRIYLETKQGLVLQNQGGARAKVKSVELRSLHVEDYRGGVLTVDADWVVNAAVGHWGHVHQRVNRYRAQLTLAALQQDWVLRDIEILEEERVK